LAQGLYSVVFYNPNKSYIIKINKSEDKAFAHYVSIIHGSRNPHFPKISDKKELKIGNETYYIYLIEKLTKVPSKIAHKLLIIFKKFIIIHAHLY